MQLPEEHRRNSREVVDAGSGGRNAQGDADDLSQLHEQREAPVATLAGGGAPHAACAAVLEGEFSFLCSGRS